MTNTRLLLSLTIFLKAKQDNVNQDIINVINIVEKRLDLDDDCSFILLYNVNNESSFLELLIVV